MTPAEALAEVQGCAKYGRYRITAHAFDRMDERGITEKELVRALCNAHGCRQEPGDKWRALGLDRCGDALEVIIAIEDEMIVITVF